MSSVDNVDHYINLKFVFKLISLFIDIFFILFIYLFLSNLIVVAAAEIVLITSKIGWWISFHVDFYLILFYYYLNKNSV